MPLYQSSSVSVGNSTVNSTGLVISNTFIANDTGLLVGSNSGLVSVNSTSIKVGNSTVNNFVVNTTGIYSGNASGVQYQSNVSGAISSISGNLGIMFSNSTYAGTPNLTITTNTGLTIGTQSVVANNGYCRLPGGISLQWGVVPANTTSPASVSLPVAITTVLNAQFAVNSAAFTAQGSYANITHVVPRSTQAVAATAQVYWLVIGVGV